MAQVIGFLVPMWKSWIELLAPDFSLEPLWALGVPFLANGNTCTHSLLLEIGLFLYIIFILFLFCFMIEWHNCRLSSLL